MMTKSAIVHAKIIFLSALCMMAFVIEGHEDDAFLTALKKGAIADLTIKVVDDEGSPVQGALIKTRFDAAFYASESFKSFTANTNGIAKVFGRTGRSVKYRVTKSGYYGASGEICYVSMGQGVKYGRWLPFDLERKVILRRIINPFADKPYVSDARYTKNIGKWIGFDLAKYDFVTPYGNGAYTDMEVKFDWDGQLGENFNGMDINIRFVEPHSGAYFQDRIMMSDFKEAYFAVTNEEYRKEFNFYSYPLRDVEGKIIKRNQKFFDSSKVLIVRSRCVVDSNGTLKQANYSEIINFTFGCGNEGAWIMFQPIFNPIPNDTNLEPKR